MSFNQDIDQRTGWPEELCALLNEYPRASWQQNMTPLAQFWIEKHNDFRSQCSRLLDAAEKFRDRPDETEEFAAQVLPRTHLLLSHLHGHHQIEDFHYFPAFRAADRRLEPGFDVLASDHELLHESSLSIIETLKQLRNALGETGQPAIDNQRQLADRYLEANDLLCQRIARHLDDEEDLVIPLMLAQS